MKPHLLLLLDAPWMAFGGEVIDAYGIVRDFPNLSMIAGLLANALGYDRSEADHLGRLQDRLVMGSARLEEGRRVRDYQTVKLSSKDQGWTTRGRTEGRAGGLPADGATHIRHRDADADALVLVALRLEPAGEAPDLDALAQALDRPERPLFLGRKPSLPSGPVLLNQIEASSIHAALRIGAEGHGSERAHRLPLPSRKLTGRFRAQWPAAEGDAADSQESTICDERAWPGGMHGGWRVVREGYVGGNAVDPAPLAGEELPDPLGDWRGGAG